MSQVSDHTEVYRDGTTVRTTNYDDGRQPRVVVTHPPGELADLTARVTALEAVLVSLIPPLPTGTAPPTIDALGAKQVGAIYVGQQITWTDGNVWECVRGPLNSNATPATYPQGWAQKTGLPPVVAPWSPAAVVYKVGDLASYTGSTYRCIQAHTSQAGWTPAAVPALWAKQ